VSETPHPIFQQFLNPGEKIIWRGLPRQGFLFQRSDVFFVPFSILWTILAVWWELETVLSEIPFQDKIWSIVMLSAAAYILLLRFLVDAAYRSLSFYALTNQRVLIHTGLLKTTLTSLPLTGMNEINLDLDKSGRGNIVFGPLEPHAWMQTGGGWPRMGKMERIPALELLEDPQAVYKKIREQRKRAR
jgi:hypothetical protein